jgi:hypothetical protein
MTLSTQFSRIAAAQQSGGTPPVYDPTSEAWLSVWWADKLVLSDGASVATWADAKGTHNLANPTSSEQPIYRASASILNNRPSVEFNVGGVASGLFKGSVALGTGAISMVMIVTYDNVGANRRLFGILSADTGRYFGGVLGTGPQWAAHRGTLLAGGTPVINTKYFLRFYLNNTSSDIRVNETSVAAGAAGAINTTQITLGGARSTTTLSGIHDGHIAFCGLFSGDVSAQGWWSTFKTWAGTYYGITIA